MKGLKDIFTKKTIIFLVALLFLLRTACANEKDSKFETYTAKNGLSQNYVTAILQDNAGMMWVGTFNGLNRFDGYKFKTFYSNLNIENTLSQSSINVIFEDKNGTLWLGTENGLNKFNELDESFTRYYNKETDGRISTENNIRTIYEDSYGIFWIGFYGGGLKTFNPTSGKFENIPELENNINTLGLSKINSFCADSKGLFWIGTELGGLITYNPSTKVTRQFKPRKNDPSTVPDRIISALVEDKYANIWIGTWSEGLVKYDRKSDKFTNFKNNTSNNHSISSNIITSLTSDKNGIIWIGTFDHGANSFDPKTDIFENYQNNPSDRNSISHNVVWRVIQDKSGVYWFGTFGGGLNKFSPESNHFELYQVDESKQNWLNNNQVNAFIETSSGELLFGTFGGGINKLERTSQTFKYLLNDSSSQGKIIRVLYEDSKKNIWVSTDQGLFQFDSKFKQKLFFRYNLNQNSIGDKSVYSIIEDINGDMWFGIWNGGIRKLSYSEMQKNDPTSMEFTHFENTNFSKSTVSALIMDTDNKIWVGANNSFYRYDRDRDRFESFEKQINSYQNGLSVSVTCFYEDKQLEKIWFGTLSNGIGYYDKTSNKIQMYTVKDGLAYNEVFSIIPDKNSNLWISTAYGLSQYNQRLNSFRNFDITHGDSQNELLNKSWLLKTNEIVIGGNKGFYIFNPESIHDNVKASPIVLTDFKIFNKSVNTYGNKQPLECVIDKAENIEISQRDNVFAFEMAVLDYRYPEKNEYQYKLEGFDKEWNSTTADNRTITYTNLEGGKYLFKYKGCNSDGIWNSEIREVKITISPLFYNTWWFRVLLLLIIISTIYLIVNQKINKLKKEIKKKHTDQNIQKLIDDKAEIAILYNELECDLDEKIKELATVKLYMQNKDENLVKLRAELKELLEQVKTTVKPQVVTIIKNIDQELKQKNGWDAFKENLDVLQNDFIKRIADNFPKLTQKDLIVCAYIRMAKTNKDIANHLNISLQSVEMARYRIRKKMDLDAKITLNDFLARF